MAIKKRFPYKAAIVACNGSCRNACAYGCVGCGLCVLSCKFDAVHLNENGIAVVDEDNLATFQTPEAVEGARAFARRRVESASRQA